MKKTLIAMAAVAVAGVASAQATITGTFGFGVTTTDYASNTSTTTLGSTDSTITFSASEDLGGGLSMAVSQSVATGGAEGGSVVNDGGSITFAGGFGSIKFGTLNASAALGEGNGNGAYTWKHVLNSAAAGGRSYQYGLYTLPAMVPGLGVALRVQNMSAATAIDFSEFTATNNGTQLRLNYATGPVSLAYYVRSNSGEAHATVDLGVAKIAMGIDTKSAADKRKEVNVKVPMGAIELAMFYGKRASTTSTEIGATYALSKRTSLNATYGSFKNAVQADALESSTRVRLTHSF